MERDGFFTDVNAYDNLNRDVRISFICICGLEGNKGFRSLTKYGGFCKECMALQNIIKIKQTCLSKYGVEHPSQSQEVKEKVKQTNLERRGVENPSQSQEVKEKMKQTNFEKRGVEYSLQSQEVREKAKQTNLERRGVEYSLQNQQVKEKMKQTNLERHGVEYSSQSQEVREKVKQTNLQRYGVEYPLQNQEVREKAKQTNLQRYGVEYPSQNAEIAEKVLKNAYKVKHYTFPDGTIRQVQGYEPFALDLLVQKYDSNNIVTQRTEVPYIWYDKHDKRCRYFPDIYIKSENKIIEVKSTWTYEKDKDDLPLKSCACKDNGYDFEVWVFDGKRNLIVCGE